MLENNYINDFYHFYSDELFGNKGFHNAKLFFNKMNKIKQCKKEIRINLFQDKLIKYLLQIKFMNIIQQKIFQVLQSMEEEKLRSIML